ncbi:MAG: RNA 2',3'-cyclic phosphodiesterase [Syntrophales bacterium]
MADGKNIRAFLAIDLPDEIKKNLTGIQKQLKSIVDGVKWVNPNGIHLTLHFFGHITGDEIELASRIVKKNMEGAESFMLNVGLVGVFPGWKRPRVLWIGIGGEIGALGALRKRIEQGLEEAGFETEDRDFKPHLTLGRIKSPAEASGVEKIIGSGKEFTAGSFTAQGLTLFKSDLHPTGAVYTKLEYFPFAINARSVKP